MADLPVRLSEQYKAYRHGIDEEELRQWFDEELARGRAMVQELQPKRVTAVERAVPWAVASETPGGPMPQPPGLLERARARIPELSLELAPAIQTLTGTPTTQIATAREQISPAIERAGQAATAYVQGPVARAAQGAWQMAGEGAIKFNEAFYDLLRFGTPHWEDAHKPWAQRELSEAVRKFSVPKRLIDGAVAVAMAPFAGFGQLIQETLADLAPAAERLPILDGVHARAIRGALGQPAFDPKQPSEVQRAMGAPMTIGELLNLAATLGTPVAAGKVFKRYRDPRPTPLPSEPAAAPAPAPVPGAGVPPAAAPVVTPAAPAGPAPPGGALAGAMAGAVAPRRAEAAARPPGEPLVAAPAEAPAVPARQAAEPLTAPRPPTDEPVTLYSQYQKAVVKAEVVLAEEARALEAERAKGLEAEAAAKRAAEVAPPPAPRAAVAAVPKAPLRPPAELEAAAAEAAWERPPARMAEAPPELPAAWRPKELTRMTPAEIIREVDRLDARSLALYKQLVAAGRGQERYAELLQKTDPLSRQVAQVRERRRALQDEVEARYGPEATRLAISPAEGEVAAPGERGAADAGLLARAAVGSLLGCAGAVAGTESEEDCVAGALIGMGVGAAASKAAAGRVLQALTEERGSFKLFRERPKADPTREPYRPQRNPAAAELETLDVVRDIYAKLATRMTAAETVPATFKAIREESRGLLQAPEGAPGRVTIGSVLGGQPVPAERLPAHADAVRMLAVSAGDTVQAIMRRIEDGEAVPPGQIRTALAVAGELGIRARDLQTRVGQRRAAERLEAASVIEAAVTRPRFRPEDIARAAERIAPEMTDAQITRLLTSLRTPEEVVTASTWLRVLPGAMLEAVSAAVLAGKSIVRNTIGMTLVAPLDLTTSAVAAGFGAVERTLAEWGVYKRREPLPGVVWTEPLQRMIGFFEAALDELQLVRHWAAWRDRSRAGGGPAPLEGRYAPRLTSANYQSEGMAGAFTDYVGRVIQLPLDFVNGTDAAGKATARRAELRAQATRQATYEYPDNLTARTARYEHLLEHPESLSAEGLAAIDRAGVEKTYTGEFESRLLRGLHSSMSHPWTDTVYRTLVEPFLRSQVRLGEVAASYTFPLNFFTASFYEEWAAGGARRQTAVAKLATGTGVIATFMYLAHQGLITGDYPDDPELRKLRIRPERSFYNSVTGTYHSYAGLGYISTLLATAANTYEFTRHVSETEWHQYFLAAGLAQWKNVDSEGWFRAVSEFVDIVRTPSDDDGVRRRLQDFGLRQAATVVAAAVHEVETLIDPAERLVMASGEYDPGTMRELNRLRDEFWSRIPGFSTAKDAHGNDLYPMTRDPLEGKPILLESIPFAMPRPRVGPVWNEIWRLRGAGIRELPMTIGGAEPTPPGLFEPAPLTRRAGVRLTPQERDRWIVIMTQVIRDDAGHTLHDSMRALIETPEYQRQADISKNNALQKRFNDFRKQAEAQLLHEQPLLAEKLEVRRMQAEIEARPPSDQPALRRMLESLSGGIGR
jgi:hypothetical protein